MKVKKVFYAFQFAALTLALASAEAQATHSLMGMSSRSPKARAAFEDGLAKVETLHVQAGLESWRKATHEDPNSALPHILLAYFSPDPTEQVAEREKALAAHKIAGSEEQLIVEWLANASQSRWVPAIQAMNGALAQHKQDKHLAWLAGWWLMLAQDQPARAIPMFERAIQLDAKFADPWNEVAYCYARTGDMDQAFQRIQHYAELLPNEANPQDSFAEISRMAGRFDDALKHYRMSLKIDPTFLESQLGLGDTYALMGDQPRARAEYEIAIQKGTKVQAVLWSLQSAATYVREGKLSAADAAFRAVAQLAHNADFANLEAEAYRSMALYATDSDAAFEALRKAEDAVKNNHKIPQALVDLELSSVLRARVDRAIRDGRIEVARQTLAQLEQMAAASPDENVQHAHHAAAGLMLMAQGKYTEAVSSLEDDERNPLSMAALAVAYEKSGATEKAHRMAARLSNLNEPTIEQAVVVPAFRRSPVAYEAAPMRDEWF
ncbi:MAG TPA: tetratricopeptide repeat protein [Candidatus Angelobacter sp.]|nr:tetratricopeptide repeat protein [Candidatus Angelobacter sp.]